MSRYALFFVLMGLLCLTMVGTTSAESNRASNLMLTYQADYFDNQWLNGDPTLQRKEVGVNFNWSTGSPGRNIPADHFSARWTSSFTLNEETTMRFFAEADDGIRILVNGQVILNAYNGEAKPGYTVERTLSPGEKEIVIEYYEHSGQARAKVYLTALDGTPVAQQPAVSEGDCVIPASGPWPPCATSGASEPAPAPAPADSSGTDCVIPASGPWPPCATNSGSSPVASDPNDCVIPASGPWPSCAQ